MIKNVKKLLPILVFTAFIFLGKAPQVLAAATFSLSPPNGSFTLNSTFSVDVKFDTGSDTVKTIKAYLTFPSNLMSVEDVTTAGTAIVTWSERLYSNTNGTINLSGDTGSSGTSGSGKLLATVKFKVKSSGVAAVKFTSASQVLKSGDGADIISLPSSTNGSYTLGTVTVTREPTASPSGSKVPEAGNFSPSLAVILISSFLIILGVWLGRSTSRNP